GGVVAGAVGAWAATVAAEFPGLSPSAENMADLALGARLRGYSFERYKTKKDEEKANGTTRLTFQLADPAAVKKAHKGREAVAGGVLIARDLVNEPPNVLGP